MVKYTLKSFQAKTNYYSKFSGGKVNSRSPEHFNFSPLINLYYWTPDQLASKYSVLND